MDEEIKKKLSNADTWLRGFFMLLFVIVLGAAKGVVVGLVIFQFLTRLLTGAVNERLVHFSEHLAQYISQTVLYICYVTEEKPYPFSDWPTSSVINSTVTKPKKKPSKKKAAESSDNVDNVKDSATADKPIANNAKPDEPINYQ